jgi:hypothetical protein
MNSMVPNSVGQRWGNRGDSGWVGEKGTGEIADVARERGHWISVPGLLSFCRRDKLWGEKHYTHNEW